MPKTKVVAVDVGIRFFMREQDVYDDTATRVADVVADVGLDRVRENLMEMLGRVIVGGEVRGVNLDMHFGHADQSYAEFLDEISD